jgi:hypothetical protein
MSITSRHDSSAAVLNKIRTIVSSPVRFTRDSTAFDMGVKSAYDTIADTIAQMERRSHDTESRD